MMRTYKGIVCEKKSKYSVFLTKEGKFLRGIPIIPNPEIGEEAEFQLVTAIFHQKRMKPFFIGPALVAAVLLVFLVASLIPQTSGALAAYVQLEGETALELGVNQEGTVVSLRSLDDDSRSQIDEWEGLPLAIVLDKAVSQMNPKAEKLEIIMVYENEEQIETKKTVEEAVRTVQTEHTNRTWHVTESTEEERTKANKNNQTIKQLRKIEQAPTIKEEQKQAPVQPPGHENKQAPPKQNPKPKVEKQGIKQEKQQEKSQKNNDKAEQKNNNNQRNNNNQNQGNKINTNQGNKNSNNQGNENSDKPGNKNSNNQENKNDNNHGNKNNDNQGNNNNKQ